MTSGDFTKINIKPGDWGGQYDSGEHKPDGAKVRGGSDNKEASSWVVSSKGCPRMFSADR